MEKLNFQKTEKRALDGRLIVVEPKDLEKMSKGRRSQYRGDGVAFSAREMDAMREEEPLPVTLGPDDGDLLG